VLERYFWVAIEIFGQAREMSSGEVAVLMLLPYRRETDAIVCFIF